MDNAVEGEPGQQPAPIRIAIVGCGPKGLYALESLCTLANGEAFQRLFDVTIYEPTGDPGAGAIYDPSQPAFLRMNFASRFIDAWDRTISPPSAQRPSLVDWLKENCPGEEDPDGFVPRAAVGRYLGDCMVEVLANRSETMRIRCCFERVDAITRQHARWRVRSPSCVDDFDEVLITTGHQDWQRRGEPSDPTSGSTSIGSIFPVERQLGMETVPAGSVVGFKGFALTWIDASLALTVGRGGFFSEPKGAPHYRPSGKEPARLMPLSRTGRPMLCKPDYRTFASPAPDTLWEERSAAIAASTKRVGSICFRTAIWPEILRAADQALGVADGTAGRWFEARRSRVFDGDRAHREMRASYRVATGQAPPDIAWALGEAWRRTYPAVVTAVSHGGLRPASWPDFAAIAQEMERIASGPPSVNMGCMLALIDAGLVDLRHVGRLADTTVDGAADAWPEGIDIRIDATIPPPRNVDAAGPIGRLLKAGHLARGPGGGIVIDASGQAIAGGRPVPGLSVLGRPTEGCVLGNDTLNRVLHRHPVDWAKRVLRMAIAGAGRQDRCLAASA